MKNSKDFKFDLILAFIMYGFIIVVIVTYTALYFLDSILQKEFKEKVKITSNNIEYLYNEKIKNIKKVAFILANNEAFKFNIVNEDILEILMKNLIKSNPNIELIKYIYLDSSIKCNKNGCYKEKVKSNKYKASEKKFVKNNKIYFQVIAPVNKKGSFDVVGKVDNFFIKSNVFNILLLDRKGNILYSSNGLKGVIFDYYNYVFSNEVLNKTGFLSKDVYVKKLDKFKLVFFMNKELINKTNKSSTKLVLIVLIFSILIAIPLGIFFSKPLYNFYQILDKKVKEEVEKSREKEQLLIYQSKLATLGEMLGNIAHQWRHPLTHLSLLIQNLEMAFKKNKLDDKRFSSFKEKSLNQINYMSNTIDDFTNFFKRDNQKENFYLDKVIENTLQLIEGRIQKYNIEIEKDIKHIQIYGYKSEFSQVILNILNNAIDVLVERYINDKKIFIRVDNEKIEIEDNAGGIESKIQDKIFEPYFTTKFQSQGTGIGLYMSRVIITQHFNSELYTYNSNKGAVFVIKL